MNCPACNSVRLSVKNSRHTLKLAITRQRRCLSCDHVFFTAEVPIPKKVVACNNTGHYHAALDYIRYLLKPNHA